MGVRRSMFVAVLGPDGSGKSTLIANLEKDLKGAFRRTVHFHLMPGLLRRRKDASPVTDPHGKPPRSLPASLLKLLYYLLDYNLGYWLKVRPALVRSTLVLFDRYYDDLLIDPKRYRYGGPMGLARWLRRFIPRPDLFLVLDVPVEKLLERKQEVEPEELQRQVKAYRRFALETPNAFLLDGSLPPEEVAREAREILLDVLHTRYLNRRRIWFPEAAEREEEEYIERSLGLRISKGRPTHTWLRLPDGRGYLLPLRRGRAFRRGLELYPAQGRRARFGKAVLGALAGMGVKGPGLARVRLEEGEDSVFATLREVFKRDDLCFAVSLGTPGPHRKPVIQVLTPEGEVLGYAKVGWNGATRELVENDARMSRAISEMNFPWLCVPEIIHFSQRGCRAILVTAPLEGLQTAKWGDEVQEKFSKAMAMIADQTRRDMMFLNTPFWKELNDRLSVLSSHLPYYQFKVLSHGLTVLKARLGNLKLPWVLRLGDTTRWNMAFDKQNGKLKILDLEYAKEDWLAGWDLFRFFMNDFSVIPQSRMSAYYRAVGVDLELANSLQLAFWLDLFTEWILTWKRAGLLPDTKSRGEFGRIANIIYVLTS